MSFPLFRHFLNAFDRAESLWPAQRGGAIAFSGLYSVGLAWVRKIPEREDFFCTPANSKAFAGTGTGTHFSFVTCDGVFDKNSPIVVTTPDGAGNDIVGANFLEFLCLGCVHGYFMLEGICQTYVQQEYLMDAHPWESFRDQQDADRYKLQQEMLSFMREELNLKPWSSHIGCFSELNERYRHRLRFNAEQREYLEDEYEYPRFMFLD